MSLLKPLALASLSATALAVHAQPRPAVPPDPRAASVEVVGHVVEPVGLAPTPERLAALAMPEGFEVSVFARDLGNPRMLAVADDGTVYVTRRALGDVLMLRDTDGDGRADEQAVVAGRPGLHGIALDGETAYLVTVRELYRARIERDGTFSPLELLADDLPDAGQHPNRTLVVGPDGKLYLSVGSTCNACNESNPESATMLRVEPDGSSRTVVATGLRNTIGFGFHPETGALFGMDHGIDWLGDNAQHEELNQIVEGAAYGWPYIYGDGGINPQDDPPNGLTMAAWDAASARPLALYTPHAAPMQMAFYTGAGTEARSAFPADFRNDAFVAMRGSWNRQNPSGYEVVRVRFDEGRPAGIEPFVTGFLQRTDADEASGSAAGGGWGHLGRLAGLAVARDGALLLTDDANGVIYRIAYTGTRRAGPRPTAPTNAAGGAPRLTDATPATPPAPTPTRLALAILAPDARRLDVRAPAFGDGQPIPTTHAAEGPNASPALVWDEGPSGTMSYVVMMEDPAVDEAPPFVHWTLYNVPASTTRLDEGLPGAPRLLKPDGALQGRNDRGTLGYTGPRPPVGDPPHPYHVQVFALDTMLPLAHGASRADLLEAMRGHVLAAGETVGTYQRTASRP